MAGEAEDMDFQVLYVDGDYACGLGCIYYKQQVMAVGYLAYGLDVYKVSG